ncbi:MAG: tol-pal system protein YbgF [Deltaproteobacteria bacterium]|nr:tol-pal system protein YbgF [Deltaproteobacteria bacterium]MBI4374781.1 tol-pal system protein YbgF [Deltaproteobacteria bacterium]
MLLWPFFTVKFLLTLFLIVSSQAAWADSVKVSKDEFEEIKRVQDSNAKILADTNLAVTELRREVQALKGLVEENRYFFQQESDKNQKLLRDFDFRMTGIEERISLHQKQLEELLKKSENEEEADYRKALSEINLGNYSQALKLFEAFSKKYPKSSLADNAQYWRGEALYASRDFASALLEFQKLVKSFPQSEKIPGAILKQGFCLFEQKGYEDARLFLNQVIQTYPNSDEAAEARERLKKIDALLAQQGVARPPRPSP